MRCADAIQMKGLLLADSQWNTASVLMVLFSSLPSPIIRAAKWVLLQQLLNGLESPQRPLRYSLPM